MHNEKPLWLGLLLAALLLYLSFVWQPIDFWALFPLSLILLIGYARFFSLPSRSKLSCKEWGLALASGILIYLLFAAGKQLIVRIYPPLLTQLEQLYTLVQPETALHYILLLIVIIPGEEIFWRGFITKYFASQTTPIRACLLGTVCYAIVHLFSGSLLLVLAAFFSGLVWSWLFLRTKGLLAPIVSHLVFDVLLLMLFPLL